MNRFPYECQYPLICKTDVNELHWFRIIMSSNWVFKCFSVQIQQLTHSFERQDIALKALIIRDRWSKKKTPIVKVLGIVCELLVNNVSALMAAN